MVNYYILLHDNTLIHLSMHGYIHFVPVILKPHRIEYLQAILFLYPNYLAHETLLKPNCHHRTLMCYGKKEKKW